MTNACGYGCSGNHKGAHAQKYFAQKGALGSLVSISQSFKHNTDNCVVLVLLSQQVSRIKSKNCGQTRGTM